MQSGENIITIVENFPQGIQDIIKKEESNSAMPILCQLICEGMESGTLKHEQKLFIDTLVCLYKAHRNNLPNIVDECKNHARHIIRTVSNLQTLNKST